MKKLILFGVLFLFNFYFVEAANCGGEVQCNCRDNLVENIVLDHDLVCSGSGGMITIGANDLVLDCNGHTIFGSDSDDSYAVYVSDKSNVTIKNCILKDNMYGLFVTQSSTDNKITDNQIIGNVYGIRLAYNTQNNIIWNNYFRSSVITNANEYSSSVNNDWDFEGVGNYWDDFTSNPGYPSYYEIPGDGDGIDWYPNLDSDGDGIFNFFDNCLNDYNPGQEDEDEDGYGDVCDIFNTDLFVSESDIVFSDEYPLIGETVTITVFFHNLQEEDPEEVLVRFYSDVPSNETFIGEDLVLIQDSLSSTFFAQIDWVPEIDGNCSIYVWVDPEDEIFEPDESNNIASKILHVKTKPDLKIRNFDIGFTNNHPFESDNIFIMAMIRNMEDEPSGPFVVRFYDWEWDNFIGEVNFSLGGLQTDVAMIPWTTTLGFHEIHVQVDSTNIVEEWDESNNHAFTYLNVTRPPEPIIKDLRDIRSYEQYY